MDQRASARAGYSQSRGLCKPDAGVRATGVVPVLHGQDYLDKPPLFYWLVMGSYRLFGVHEWAARLVAGLVGVLTVAVGPGWVFMINTLTFLAMLGSIRAIPLSSLRVQPRAAAGKGRIREGLRYVRNRCHHELAAAIYPDPPAPGGWRWYGSAHLPPEDVGRGHDREGAKNYSDLLEQRPVLETLEIVERHFRSIVPDHEL